MRCRFPSKNLRSNVVQATKLPLAIVVGAESTSPGRQSKISQFNYYLTIRPLLNEYVLQFDVPVYYILLLLQISEAFKQLMCYLLYLALGNGTLTSLMPLLDVLQEVTTAKQLHHNYVKTVIMEQLVDLHNIFMLDLSENAQLSQQLLLALF